MDGSDQLRNFQLLKELKFDDEKYKTATSIDQIETERRVEKCFVRFEAQAMSTQHMEPKGSVPKLHRMQHIKFLESMLRTLPTNYECLDSSQPWLIYWILNAAHLLNFRFPDELLSRVVKFLIRCRSKDGGFCGGPGQIAHLATTYGAVNALCIIGTPEAYDAIDKPSLLKFLYRVRHDESGAFRMDSDGEIDVRGAYCAVSVAKLVNISVEEEAKLFKGTVDWIASCQTYEGGMGGVPDKEAHGGYTFCGIAAMALLGSTGKCNLDALLRWTVNKQMEFEGGFQGRTNKLVDGCYSFWCGAIVPVVQAIISKKEPYLSRILKKPVFDTGALQEYIFICCQRPSGGLIDKPDTPPDLYHTCYTLSGVSIAQHSEVGADPFVIGNLLTNELLPTHPLYNIPPKCAWQAFVHFQNYNNTDECSGSDTATANVDDAAEDNESLGNNEKCGSDDMNGH